MLLCEEEQAKYSVQAEDAEEYKHEGVSLHGIHITSTDIPYRKSVTLKEVIEEDTTEVLQPVVAEAKEARARDEEFQEKKESGKEDDLVSDLNDAASRIQAGRRGDLTRMTLNPKKVTAS